MTGFTQLPGRDAYKVVRNEAIDDLVHATAGLKMIRNQMMCQKLSSGFYWIV